MGFVYTVTGFTPAYWNSWGVSFFASWKEFAGPGAGRLILVHNGELPALAKKKLLDEAVILIPTSGTENMRFLTWQAIANYKPEYAESVFVYWDGDCYFQSDVAPLFDAAAKKMVLSENLNPGMVGGPRRLWQFLNEFHTAIDTINPGIQPQDVIGAFALHFPKLVSVQPNTWNFTNLPALKPVEGQYGYKGDIVRVVHPAGVIKTFPEARQFLFQDKYPNLYNRWNTLMNKGQSRNFLKRVHHVEAVKSE